MAAEQKKWQENQKVTSEQLQEKLDERQVDLDTARLMIEELKRQLDELVQSRQIDVTVVMQKKQKKAITKENINSTNLFLPDQDKSSKFGNKSAHKGVYDNQFAAA